MKFKFRFAVIISVILHISLFALAVYLPRIQGSSGTIYYVDLMSMPGGGGGGGDKSETQAQLTDPGSVRDLTVKKEPPKSKLTYPDREKKKTSPKKKKKKDKAVTVVKRKKFNDKFKKENSNAITTRRRSVSDGLRTGISAGSGGGRGGGSGTGSGAGFGSGTGTGNFPYAYYIQTLRNKISASWYSSLVSPGLRGKYTAAVYFRILRSGNVTELKLEQKSGNNSLDLSAIRAIRAASPFPPLPPDFAGRYLGVHFEFEWEK